MTHTAPNHSIAISVVSLRSAFLRNGCLTPSPRARAPGGLEVISDHERQDEHEAKRPDSFGVVEVNRRDRRRSLEPSKADVSLDDVLMTVLVEHTLVCPSVAEPVSDEHEARGLAPGRLDGLVVSL